MPLFLTQAKHMRKYWTEVTKRRVAATQQFKCALCRNMLDEVWAADHKVPLHLGGSNAVSNCQILCPLCHARKTQQEACALKHLQRERSTGLSKYWDPQSVYYNHHHHPSQARWERWRTEWRERAKINLAHS